MSDAFRLVTLILAVSVCGSAGCKLRSKADSVAKSSEITSSYGKVCNVSNQGDLTADGKYRRFAISMGIVFAKFDRYNWGLADDCVDFYTREGDQSIWWSNSTDMIIQLKGRARTIVGGKFDVRQEYERIFYIGVDDNIWTQYRPDSYRHSTVWSDEKILLSHDYNIRDAEARYQDASAGTKPVQIVPVHVEPMYNKNGGFGDTLLLIVLDDGSVRALRREREIRNDRIHWGPALTVSFGDKQYFVKSIELQDTTTEKLYATRAVLTLKGGEKLGLVYCSQSLKFHSMKLEDLNSFTCSRLER